jgi:5'-nucleotidase
LRLLLSNDDGLIAPGLVALAEALSAEHEVWVVAPSSERSAQSHSLTMHKPLRLHPRQPRQWSVSGTPADCVYIALHHLMADSPPDLVLSGINSGSNLGSDVHYSGTVAAAREACLHGYPSIAISLHRHSEVKSSGAKAPQDDEQHWGTAVHVAKKVLAGWSSGPMPPKVFLNVNVPNVPLPQLQGLRACRLGERFYGVLVDERIDPRGRPYVWIGGPHLRFGDDAGSDGPSVEAGYATVTPLEANITDEHELVRLRSWTDG